MEQQKVLWIIFSVTLFLVVVVVVGFVWFLPPEEGEPDVAATAAGSEAEREVFDPIVWVRDDEDVPGMQEKDDAAASQGGKDLLLIYGEADEQPAEETEPADGDSGLRVVEERSEGTAPGTASGVVQGRVAGRVTEPVSDQVAAITQEQRGETTAKRATPSVTRPAKATAAAPRSEPASERITHYWIQAGSFQSQSRAEQTQAELADRGWNTRIISREVGGEVYFRVRLGPFETKDEAGKFLGWITDIESFESSYISEVYTTRRIN